MWRNNQSVNQPLVLDQNTGDTLLSTNDQSFGAGGGIRVGAGMLTCGKCGWELGYMGIFDQTASSFLSETDRFRAPGDLGFNNNFTFADEVSARYVSNIHSGEINHVCCSCCCDCPTRCSSVDWLYGFRYFNLNEEFALTYTDFLDGTSTYRVRTNNNLYGGQIGARLRHCYGRWSWEGTGKAGLYANDAKVDSDPIVDFLDFELRPGTSVTESDVAFVGELNLTGIYQLNQTWGLRAGYNLIWIEGVALAPDQLDFSIPQVNGQQLVTDGGVFLHGVNVGLEARW